MLNWMKAVLDREYVLLRDVIRLRGIRHFQRSAVIQAVKYGGLNIALCSIALAINAYSGAGGWLSVFFGCLMVLAFYEYLRTAVVTVAFGDVVQVRSIGHYGSGWPQTYRVHRFVDAGSPVQYDKPDYTFVESAYAKNVFPADRPYLVLKHPAHRLFVVPLTEGNVNAYAFDRSRHRELLRIGDSFLGAGKSSAVGPREAWSPPNGSANHPRPR